MHLRYRHYAADPNGVSGTCSCAQDVLDFSILHEAPLKARLRRAAHQYDSS
jgi:hypothetical protein